MAPSRITSGTCKHQRGGHDEPVSGIAEQLPADRWVGIRDGDVDRVEIDSERCHHEAAQLRQLPRAPRLDGLRDARQVCVATDTAMPSPASASRRTSAARADSCGEP